MIPNPSENTTFRSSSVHRPVKWVIVRLDTGMDTKVRSRKMHKTASDDRRSKFVDQAGSMAAVTTTLADV